MEIKHSWKYGVAFMAFVFVFGQLHEMAHLTAADVICGCPGRQADFNLWTLGERCGANPHGYMATIYGPLFSITLMWLGYLILKYGTRVYWQAGFMLIMGNLAFARVFTALMGGGDEKTVLRVWLPELPLIVVKILAFALVSTLCLPPLYMVYHKAVNKRKLWLILGYCILPLLIMKFYEFVLLGKIIQSGFLAGSHLLGVADFIYFHTALMTLIVIVLWPTLFRNTSIDAH